MECLLRCLLWCATSNEDATSTAVVNVLLEAIAPVSQAAAADADRLTALAAELMLLYCSNGSARLASKVGWLVQSAASVLVFRHLVAGFWACMCPPIASLRCCAGVCQLWLDP